MFSSHKRAHGPVTWPVLPSSPWSPLLIFFVKTLPGSVAAFTGEAVKAFPTTLHPFIASLIKVSFVHSRVHRKSSWNADSHVYELCSCYHSMATDWIVLIPGTKFFWCWSRDTFYVTDDSFSNTYSLLSGTDLPSCVPLLCDFNLCITTSHLKSSFSILMHCLWTFPHQVHQVIRNQGWLKYHSDLQELRSQGYEQKVVSNSGCRAHRCLGIVVERSNDLSLYHLLRSSLPSCFYCLHFCIGCELLSLYLFRDPPILGAPKPILSKCTMFTSCLES